MILHWPIMHLLCQICRLCNHTLFKFRFNIILPSTNNFFKNELLLLGYPTENFVSIYSLSPTLGISCLKAASYKILTYALFPSIMLQFPPSVYTVSSLSYCWTPLVYFFLWVCDDHKSKAFIYCSLSLFKIRALKRFCKASILRRHKR